MFFYFVNFVIEFKVETLQCPPLPLDRADRGGAAGGGVWQWIMFEICFAFLSFAVGALQ